MKNNRIKYGYYGKVDNLSHTLYHTTMPNIEVAMGNTHGLSQAETLAADSTDYLGNLILENGKVARYLFGEGYADISDKDVTYHYYNKDHLGNIREVTAENGTIEQVNNYYPFGLPYSDGTGLNADLQKYKYNGKELDKTHGLNTYDYGARQYDPVLGVWDRMDPLCEKYYNVSPYVYCMDNPVNNIDPDGKKIKPDANAYSIILNTLSEEEQKYIILNDMGFIDMNTMMECNSQSHNFQSLRTLVESPIQIDVTTLRETQYISDSQIKKENFNEVEYDFDFIDKTFTSPVGNIEGAIGNLGVTYMPTKGGSGKGAVDDEKIHININPTLSKIAAAETFSHEGYGHAYLYIISGGNRKIATHDYRNGNKDVNILLKKKSIDARKETINNLLK